MMTESSAMMKGWARAVGDLANAGMMRLAGTTSALRPGRDAFPQPSHATHTHGDFVKLVSRRPGGCYAKLWVTILVNCPWVHMREEQQALHICDTGKYVQLHPSIHLHVPRERIIRTVKLVQALWKVAFTAFY